MAQIGTIGRIMVPVSDQDEGIAFYSGKLGFTVSADVPFGEGDRWVEVTPPAGGTRIALVPPQDEYKPGRITGIAFESTDPRADHAEFKQRGVDVDEELWGGDGMVPLGFFFRDHDGNQLMVVEKQ